MLEHGPYKGIVTIVEGHYLLVNLINNNFINLNHF